MTVTKEDISKYLTDLRDSGVVNMWGAVPYLQEEFDMTHRDAKDALLGWIESFKESA
jgi:hypothetical protein